LLRFNALHPLVSLERLAIEDEAKNLEVVNLARCLLASSDMAPGAAGVPDRKGC
jgi:hypothetical protein